MAKKSIHIVDLQTADKVTGDEYLVLQDAQGIEYVLVGELESVPVFTPGQYYIKQGDSYVVLDEIPENWSEMYQTTYTRNTPDTKKAKIKDVVSVVVSSEVQDLETTIQENADALQQNIIKTAENTEAINLLAENDRLQDDTLQEILTAQKNSIGQNGTGPNAEIFNDYTGNNASGPLAHSEGSKTTSSGEASHSEGIGTTATGNASHSEGKNSSADGEASHSEGFATQAKAVYSHSEGQNSVANGFSSHAEGSATTNGKYSHAEGFKTISNGDYSHAEGDTSIAGVKGYTIVAANSSTSTIVLSSTGNLSVGTKIGVYDKKQADNRILSVATITSIDTKGNIVVKMIGEAPFSSYFTVGNIVINMNFVTSYTGSEDAIVGGHVAHAEGRNTKAIGTASHSEGNITTANGEYSHAEGSYTETLNDYAHAEGYNTKARGIASHSEGTGTESIGTSAHGEGVSTKAIGDTSHSEGNSTVANGKCSHAEGHGSKTGIYGCMVVSTDETAQSAVLKTVGNLAVGTVIGTYQNSYGIVKSIGNIKTIDSSTKTVTFNLASGVTFSNAIFEGAVLVDVSTFNDSDDTESVVGGNDGAHSEGRNTKAIGTSSHAEGNTTTANGTGSHAEGNGSIAGGASAHAEGVATKAMGEGSHAENGSTQARGGYSHAEGWATKVYGKYSHTEGRYNVEYGTSNHVENESNTLYGQYTHVEGYRKDKDALGVQDLDALLKSCHFENESGVNMRDLPYGSYYVDSQSIEVISTPMYSSDPSSPVYFDSLQKGDIMILDVNTKVKIYGIFESITTLEPQGDDTRAVYKLSEAYATDGLPDSTTSVWGGRVLALHYDSTQKGYTIINDYKKNISDPIEHAHGEGSAVITDSYQHGEGYNTRPYGKGSHTEGKDTVTFGDYSHAEGNGSAAFGFSAHAEGSETRAIGSWSHAEGKVSYAYGTFSHAEGVKTHAKGSSSHSEGTQTLADGEGAHAEGKFNKALNRSAHAEGEATTASGVSSHSEGGGTVALGENAHAEGSGSHANGDGSHSEGRLNDAEGANSHAEGQNTTAAGNASHSEGISTKAEGEQSHSEGYKTVAKGSSSHAEGMQTNAIGESSHAEGTETIAVGDKSHAEGYQTQTGIQGYIVQSADETTNSVILNTLGSLNKNTVVGFYTYDAGEYYIQEIATISSVDSTAKKITVTMKPGFTFSSFIKKDVVLINMSNYENSGATYITGADYVAGYRSHSEGNETMSIGESSHAEGKSSKAIGEGSHAEGRSTITKGKYSHAEGYSSEAYGDRSHSEGDGSYAAGENSHAEGIETIAEGNNSHSEGNSTKANGNNSHSEGYGTKADGECSHAEGFVTIASSKNQHAQGRFNIEDTKNKYAHIVGNGESPSNRANAHTLDWDGNSWYQGKIKIGGAGYDDANAKEVATVDIKLTGINLTADSTGEITGGNATLADGTTIPITVTVQS